MIKTASKSKYERWLEASIDDKALDNEMQTIKDDKVAIEERFCQDLSFGTAGLRGILGVGTNRMNIYTVRKASQALADYLNESYHNPSIAIAYDSRINSPLFAQTAASVFSANNIKTYICSQLMATPLLSYTVRKLKCSAGINVTASHNPYNYNGYKVYDNSGCQISEKVATLIAKNIAKLDEFTDIKIDDLEMGFSTGKIQYIPNVVIDEYYDYILSLSILNSTAEKQLKIVYSPLNGTGLLPVKAILNKTGFTKVDIVKEQQEPDGLFPTCPTPNPELKETLKLGIDLAKKSDADVVIATDPDCDRIGVAVKYDGDYTLLSGNEIGILLFDFICSYKKAHCCLPDNSIVIESIVSSNMIEPIARKHGVKVIKTLTGFKYIGKEINCLAANKTGHFLFGFEESCGYLSGTEVRDKDGVNAVLLVCEMLEYYAMHSVNIVDRLKDLYVEFGYYLTATHNYTFKGIKGQEEMQQVMEQLRKNSMENSLWPNTVAITDYLSGKKILKNGTASNINYPKANVLQFDIGDGSTILIRPSGTEPKLKLYILARNDDQEKCLFVLGEYCNIFDIFIEKA